VTGDRVRLDAPAKLTLTLRVLGTRADGFHELEALTVSISAPTDTVVVTAAPAGVVEFTVTGGGADIPHDDTNLAVRAARAVLPPDAGVAITLAKVVPSGAGLGGGSADAAAVLRAVRDLHGLAASDVARAAADLGSDVPVCLHGGPVMMRGRGERLEPVVLAGDLHVVVATPPFPLATPRVFAAWDRLGGPAGRRVVPVPDAVAHLVDGLVNDLEPAAEAVAPELREFRVRLEAIAGQAALLAGSGSSYWIPTPDAAAASALAARIRSELGIEAFAGRALRSPFA
jgi:4-diphosphocytidyl-2-C-methyl-D-erythritol kinase